MLNLCSEADEIYKICSVIGSPTEETWLEGLNLASVINYQFPQVFFTPLCNISRKESVTDFIFKVTSNDLFVIFQLPGVHLSSVMPYASADAVNLIERLCSWDPCNRPTTAEALQHPFFQSCYYVPPSLRPKLSVGPRGSLEQQQSVKRLPAAPTYNANKPLNTYVTPKTNAPFSNGVNSYVAPKTKAPFSNGVNSYVAPKTNASFGNGVNSYVTLNKVAPFDNGANQRKVDMANNNNQNTAWNNKPVRSYNVKDAKYRPPGRKSPGK